MAIRTYLKNFEVRSKTEINISFELFYRMSENSEGYTIGWTFNKNTYLNEWQATFPSENPRIIIYKLITEKELKRFFDTFSAEQRLLSYKEIKTTDEIKQKYTPAPLAQKYISKETFEKIIKIIELSLNLTKMSNEYNDSPHFKYHFNITLDTKLSLAFNFKYGRNTEEKFEIRLSFGKTPILEIFNNSSSGRKYELKEYHIKPFINYLTYFGDLWQFNYIDSPITERDFTDSQKKDIFNIISNIIEIIGTYATNNNYTYIDFNGIEFGSGEMGFRVEMDNFILNNGMALDWYFAKEYHYDNDKRTLCWVFRFTELDQESEKYITTQELNRFFTTLKNNKKILKFEELKKCSHK